jgi:hypothetical protein
MRKKLWLFLGGAFAAVTIMILLLALIPNVTVQIVGSFVGVIWWILLVAILLIGYIQLAQMVGRAAERKGRSATSWTLIAFIFGLIIPAIIVAVMGTRPIPSDRICPFCAEPIQPTAIKCKHCGSNLAQMVGEGIQ